MAEKDAAKPEKKGSGILKILLLLIGGLILVGGSIGATLLLTGALNKGAASGEEHAAAAPAHGAEAPTHGGINAAMPIPLRGPPIYLPIDPAFVVNFEDQGMLRYLQIGLTVMARNQQIIDAVNQSMPQIRNDLILLFSNQKMEVLNSLNGKEKLRMQALAQIQGILTREIGIPGVEAVYFTAFVLQ
ncbi:MAG: flagellar basal body-associated FliL family protein [Candidatus Competibacteraceae bacterium]|nr:flagellar basal body-associated FliL family protein [Candidatus Competibacteraceae bacterium]MCP5125014.1 flagellar basal body-associated FliL family protein [Gammaproteobacteria bacterium]